MTRQKEAPTHLEPLPLVPSLSAARLVIVRSMNELEVRHPGRIPFVHDLSADYDLATLRCRIVANTSQHKELRNGGKRSSGLPGSRLLEASARLQFGTNMLLKENKFQ